MADIDLFLQGGPKHGEIVTVNDEVFFRGILSIVESLESGAQWIDDNLSHIDQPPFKKHIYIAPVIQPWAPEEYKVQARQYWSYHGEA